VSVGLPQVGQHWGFLAVGLTHEGLECVQGHNPGTDLSGLQCGRKELQGLQQLDKATRGAHPSVLGVLCLGLTGIHCDC
jgi:hypothetical protein